jgi:haloalkane dehalogenase
MHYVDEGTGPTLVMVHGNPTWSFMYRRVIAAFRPRFRCLAPDHLGMGLSERPAGGGARDLRARAEDLGAFLDQVAPDGPVRLIAHDWGGPVALSWAVRHPERVASVCLMNTGLRFPRGYAMPWRLRAFQRYARLGTFLARDLGLFARGLLKAGTVRPLSPPAAGGLVAPYARRELREAVAGFVRDIPWSPGHPSRAYLSETDRLLEESLSEKPFLLAWGMRDFVFTPLFLYDLKRRLPRARALALPRSGHYLLEDEPARILRALTRFWTGR